MFTFGIRPRKRPGPGPVQLTENCTLAGLRLWTCCSDNLLLIGSTKKQKKNTIKSQTHQETGGFLPPVPLQPTRCACRIFSDASGTKSGSRGRGSVWKKMSDGSLRRRSNEPSSSEPSSSEPSCSELRKPRLRPLLPSAQAGRTALSNEAADAVGAFSPGPERDGGAREPSAVRRDN